MVLLYFFLSKNFFPILLKPDGTRTIGACVKDNTTIYVSENLNDEMLKRVLCHEFTHVTMFSYGVFLTKEQKERLECEEGVVVIM